MARLYPAECSLGAECLLVLYLIPPAIGAVMWRDHAERLKGLKNKKNLSVCCGEHCLRKLKTRRHGA